MSRMKSSVSLARARAFVTSGALHCLLRDRP
jgi:hypothetical protein